MSQVPVELLELIDRFERNHRQYSSIEYKEAELRREFIDPLFELLGWDMQNKKGFAEQYKEVKYEPSLEVEGSTKAPDYAFRIGESTKFLLEAKKPSVDVVFNSLPAFQLRRYAWSQGVSLSILTNFEDIMVYDGRFRPKKTDNSSVARVIRTINYKDLEKRWGELVAIFSRDAVLKGSFDRFAEESKAKRGTSEVNDEFLKDIEDWRETLAKNIALRNSKLTIEELNFSVQKIIDRIIFLRMCEDRGTEPSNHIREISEKANIYRRLVDLFQQADTKYNSGIFHFQQYKDKSVPIDEITPKLKIDDDILLKIIKGLYYPDSPYQFDVIPADILGQVYEQFLGKVIRLTEGHHAKIEEKPEVKKSGGVYYTPTYIVNYIIENTVGQLCKNKSPKEMERLRILDPACGSGSFLIRAYVRLLKEYQAWYVANSPKKWKDEIFQDSRGGWTLTLKEKKRILLNNIYGVDIDAQAVEVTKLNLLLKALEGESKESIDNVKKWFREPALPDLDNNVKCGNSLVGTDVLEMIEGFPEAERNLQASIINPFDWDDQNGFPNIMKEGGFDAIIGNPPYRMLQPHNTSDWMLAYLKGHFFAADFKIDFFHLFLQKGIQLLRENGLLGFIIPTSLLNNVYVENLRTWIMDHSSIKCIAVCPEKVFKKADVHTTVLILQRELNEAVRNSNLIFTTTKLNEANSKNTIEYSSVRQDRFNQLAGKTWNVLINEHNASLIERLTTKYAKLGQIASINRGLISGDRDKYFSNDRKTKEYVPIICGSDVFRYYSNSPTEYVLFRRPESAGGCWDPKVHFALHKIVVRQIGFEPSASFVDIPTAVTGNIFTIIANDSDEERYILGLFNSKLMKFYWKTMLTDFKSSFPQVTIFSLSQLPIRTTDPNVLSEKKQRDEVISRVDRMLKLHKDLAEGKTPDEKTRAERLIEAIDRQINELVYEAYGLTEEEIRIIEQQ